MVENPHFSKLMCDRPWLSNYPEGVPHNIESRDVDSLGETFRQTVRKYPDRPAAISFGATLTYAQLGNAAEQIASWLIARSAKAGDRIAIMMPNVMAYPAVLYGILIARCTVVGINPLYTATELARQLNDSGARTIFVLENFSGVVEEAMQRTSLETVVVAKAGDLLGIRGMAVNIVAKWVKRAVPSYRLAGHIPFSSITGGRQRPPARVEPNLDDIAFLQYTGGTTGSPKGAMLSHRNVATNVEQSIAWFGPMLRKYAGQHVMVTALPLYHILALQACCLSMTRLGGACLLIANPRDIKGFIRTLRRSKFTLFCGLNTLFNALSNHDDLKSVDFSDVQFCNSGGMATQAAVAERWTKITGARIVEGYGLSETSPVLTVNPWNVSSLTGTIGYPVPSTDISIRDADGRPVPPGHAGELCAKGPQVMIGYWNLPEETSRAMTPDGYFRTGDIAVMLPDGQFKIVDRLKDMILVSGFNVYPTEVEEVIASCEGVLEAAVIGLADETSGEKVAAFVVRKDPTLTEEKVRQHCRTFLTPYKVPRVVEFRSTLPKSNVGKILRRDLRNSI